MSDPKHQSNVNAPTAAIQVMHPVVQAGLQHLGATPDPATLRELLAVQREWEQGEAKKAFTRALAALKRDLPTVIARDSVVDFTSAKGRTHYRHTSLAAVMDAVTGPLTQHGFSLSWHPATTGTGTGTQVTVSCKLVHAEGHFEETSISAPVDTSGSKSPAQGVASTITLLSRYTALSLLGIATADMPEPRGGDDEPKQPTNAVDAERNLRAMGRLAKLGKTREQAEEFVGRPVSEWTDADLQNLKQWVTPKREDQPEPGSNG
jgi:ERF superfamily protein